MADFVRYELEDGTEVLFEAAEGDLVSLRAAASRMSPRVGCSATV